MGTSKTAALEMSPDRARKLWALTLLGSAGLGLTGGLIHPFLESKMRQKKELPSEDLDVDILDPSELRRIRSQIQQELQAQETKESSVKTAGGPREIPGYAWIPLLASLGALGFGGGSYLGNRMSDRISNAQMRSELDRAKRRFRDALLQEQLAAVESGRTPYAPFMPKSSSVKEAESPSWWELGGDILKLLPVMSAAGGLALTPLAFQLSRNYMQEESENWQKWNKARKELHRRLMQELPYAQLSRQLPAGVREQLKSRFQEGK